MRNFGLTSVSEYLGDRIVYRNLVPADPSMPPLQDFASQIGLPGAAIPRKSEPDYTRAVAFLLNQARQLTAPGVKLVRLVFLGDTQLLYAAAYDNLCQVGGWRGLAFIGSENNKPRQVDLRARPMGTCLC